MKVAARDGIRLHVAVTGPDDGPPVVLAGSLGTTLQSWDLILPFLPRGLRFIRYDMRGHGQSDVPAPPYKIGQMISDAEAICEACNVRDALFVGMSVGGMVAQGLAVKRPDMIRALVLSNTSVRVGTPQGWQDRIDRVMADGMSGIADMVMKLWFGPGFYGAQGMPEWLRMLMETPPQGYIGVCHAIAGADFYATTRQLRIPTLGIAGADDGATPADLVREMIDLIPGAQMIVMRRAGHLPCVEDPETYAGYLTGFMSDIGHI